MEEEAGGVNRKERREGGGGRTELYTSNLSRER